jgi:hypothetical protein
MVFSEEGTMGLALVLFWKSWTGKVWSGREGVKLGQELHHSVKKEWLDFHSRCFDTFYDSMFPCCTCSVPIKLYW